MRKNEQKLKISREELVIPGLFREYTVVHLSDAHLSYADETCNEQEKRYAEERNAYWSAYGTHPGEAFRSALEYAASVRPDAVVVTGDAMDYCSRSNISAVRAALSVLPREIPVLYVRGNHEGLKEFNGLFDGLCGADPEFQVLAFDGFLLVGIDDGWEKQTTTAQYERLRALDARGKPLILAMHVPVSTASLTPEILRVWGGSEENFRLGAPNDPPETEKLYRFLTEESKEIRAILAGHVHFSHAGEFAPGRMQFVAAPTFEGFVRVLRIRGER